jgi:WD40 repeat protein
MLTKQFNEKQSYNLVAYKNKSFDNFTKEYQFKLNKNFLGLGIRYLHYFEKDNTLLISNISNGIVHLINLSNGSFRSFLNHTATVRKIRIFNNEIITSSWDSTVRVTNYLSMKQRLKLTDRTMGRCPFFNISPDGKYLFSFTYDSDVVPLGVANTVRKWSFESGNLLRVVSASTDYKNERRSGSIIMYADKLYVCCDNGYFRIFKMQSGRLIKQINTEADFRSMTSLFHYHYLLASDWDGYVHFFNLKYNRIDFKIKCHNTDILCIRVHPKRPDIIITSSMDGVIKFWKMPGFELIKSIEIDHSDLWSMVFINDRLAIGNADGEICIYDIRDIDNIQFKGRLVLAERSYVVQAIGTKMFFTNDLSKMEVYRDKEADKIEGKESLHLLSQSNNIMVLRELFGMEDNTHGQLNDHFKFMPLLQDSFG